MIVAIIIHTVHFALFQIFVSILDLPSLFLLCAIVSAVDGNVEADIVNNLH